MLKPLNQSDYKMKIIQDLGTTKHGVRKAKFECTICEKHEIKQAYKTKTKLTCSFCAKTKANTKHGESHTHLYKTYHGMKARCRREKGYCDRGIKLLITYEEFKKWSLANGYAKNLSIDRIDNNGNYEKGNLRWATDSVQQSNKRKQKRNRTGLIGVYKRGDRKDYYRCEVIVNGKKVFCKYGKDPFALSNLRDEFIITHKLPHTLSHP